MGLLQSVTTATLTTIGTIYAIGKWHFDPHFDPHFEGPEPMILSVPTAASPQLEDGARLGLLELLPMIATVQVALFLWAVLRILFAPRLGQVRTHLFEVLSEIYVVPFVTMYDTFTLATDAFVLCIFDIVTRVSNHVRAAALALANIISGGWIHNHQATRSTTNKSRTLCLAARAADLFAIVPDTATVRRTWQSRTQAVRDTMIELQEFFLACHEAYKLVRTKRYGKRNSEEDLGPTEEVDGVQEIVAETMTPEHGWDTLPEAQQTSRNKIWNWLMDASIALDED